MSRVFGYLVAVLLVPSVAAPQTLTVQSPFGGPAIPAPQLGAPPRDNQVRTGTAILRGRVAAADSGQPLRKAQVRLIAAAPPSPGGFNLPQQRMTSTDAEGRYEFKELPAGRYTITANKGSYVSLSYGQRRPNEPGRPLEILDGQTVEQIDFILPRGAIITGRILDEFGEPAADVRVSPMRSAYVQGRRQLIPTGRQSMTNDIGEFRIYGLAPGQYYLSAAPGGFAQPNVESDDRSGYAPTYYPGTPNLAEAQRLTVGIGQTINDVNMALVATRTARVTGTAIDSQGRPMAGGMIMVAQRNAGAFGFSMGFGNQIRPDGSFTLSGLAPGDYTLQTNMPGGFGDAPESAIAQISVSGDDVSGVQLIAVKPSTLSGRLIVSDPAAAKTLQPGVLRLGAMPKNPDGPMLNPGVGRVNDDFTFEIKAPPGLRTISTMTPLPGWALKTVRVNGTDVTDAGIDVRASEDVSGIEVELTNHLSDVSGVVTNSRGEPVKDYSVVFFPQDRERWQSPNRFFRTGRPDQDGRFKVTGLPAGEYYAIAVDSVDPIDAADPEFLDRASRDAKRFSLNDAETKTLDLKVTTGL